MRALEALSLAPALPPALELERLDQEAGSAYWLRFLNSRWLVYWHERLIGDFPAQHASMALTFLRRKQSELPAHS
ncbi:MAG TPA: hypothetical protein VGF92_00470 [Stellaceae bacterium]|jgi:hypothetical protein